MCYTTVTNVNSCLTRKEPLEEPKGFRLRIGIPRLDGAIALFEGQLQEDNWIKGSLVFFAVGWQGGSRTKYLGVILIPSWGDELPMQSLNHKRHILFKFSVIKEII